EPQGHGFFLPLWMMLGWASRLTGLSVVVVFHIARVLSALLVLMAAWLVGRVLMKSRARLSFLLWTVGFSGGLGWLVFAVGDLSSILSGKSAIHGYQMGTMPVDINMPEATVFRSAYCQVHMNLGAALICASIVLLIKAIAESNERYAVGAGLLATVLALVHPYQVVVTGSVAVVIWATVAVAALFPRQRNGVANMLRLGAAFLLASLPGLIYLIYVRNTDNVVQEWLRTMSTLSPNPIQYLLGFGVSAFLGIAGMILLWRGKKLPGRLLLVWMVIQTLLLYAPVNFQRRLVEGLQVPLSVAFSIAIFWLLRKIHVRPRRLISRRVLLSGVVIFASLTSVGFIAGAAAGLGEPDARRYLDSNLASALKWVGANAEPDSVLLSSYMTGNVAPAISGLGVYLGHYDQTLRSREKGQEIAEFYSGAMPASYAADFVAQNHLSYCVYGPFERQLFPSFRAPEYFQLIYRSPSVDIYKIDNPAAAKTEGTNRR
ncbi:MAG TPA: hypothetical protein VI756_26025, partial [Blastocatellia bacterium]